jgi:hypothetical protein
LGRLRFHLSITLLSTPHVIGLMKPSGGGGEYEELILRIWATHVGSFGIQFPMMIRPPRLDFTPQNIGDS